MELRGRRVLLFGTGGAQGAGLVDLACERGAIPVRVSSDPARVATWRRAGLQAELADLTRPDTMRGPAARASAAVLHAPASIDPRRRLTGLLFSVGALRDAGLPVVVSVGAPVPPASVPDMLGVRTLARVLIDEGTAILAPTAYLERHAAPWALTSLLAGELVYPRQPEVVAAWLTARDVNRAALAALAADVGGELIPLAGPSVLSFADLAREIGAGMGRPIRFRALSVDEYERLLRAVPGPSAAARIAQVHYSLSEERDALMTADTTASWNRLGLAPSSAADWAATHLAPLVAALGGAPRSRPRPRLRAGARERWR